MRVPSRIVFARNFYDVSADSRSAVTGLGDLLLDSLADFLLEIDVLGDHLADIAFRLDPETGDGTGLVADLDRHIETLRQLDLDLFILIGLAFDGDVAFDL